MPVPRPKRGATSSRVERERVAGDHVQSARVAGAEAVQDVARGPDDVRVDFPQAGVATEARHAVDALGVERVVGRVQPVAQRLDVARDPAREGDCLGGRGEQKARSAGHAVLQQVGADRACRRRRRRACRAGARPRVRPRSGPAARTAPPHAWRPRQAAWHASRVYAPRSTLQRSDDRHGQHHVRGQRLDQRREVGRRPRPVEDEVVRGLSQPRQRLQARLSLDDLLGRVAVRPAPRVGHASARRRPHSSAQQHPGRPRQRRLSRL